MLLCSAINDMMPKRLYQTTAITRLTGTGLGLPNCLPFTYLASDVEETHSCSLPCSVGVTAFDSFTSGMLLTIISGWFIKSLDQNLF
jgi:hypothetical protein